MYDSSANEKVPINGFTATEKKRKQVNAYRIGGHFDFEHVGLFAHTTCAQSS